MVPHEDAMAGIGAHLAAITALLREPAVRGQLGEGLSREIAYVAAAFRARMPDKLPGAQRELALDQGSGDDEAK